MPPAFGELRKLNVLLLRANQLNHLPSEIGRLRFLKSLDLRNNRLEQLPSEIGQLVHLYEFDLGGNGFDEMLPEIGLLTKLRILGLTSNQLKQLPHEFSNLAELQELHLDHNQLTQFPPELWKLEKLQTLSLADNRMTQIPAEIASLTSLVSLSLQNNQLRELPPEIAKLMQLQRLDLSSTQITQLTAEIAQLIRLQVLRLSNTPLRRLPSELGWLTNLTGLELYNCSNLLSPPPEIVARGTDAILTFLRELQYNSVVRYETKLLVVGEGGTGKSSLLRKLRNETFDTGLTTTHGIEVDSLVLPDPNRSEVLMTLNTWDFGGQEIYHATHQFFLTHRSLYLVVWNARLGEKQGRLDYWLNTIKALAPDAPVLLVATHIDERQPDLNYQSYKEAYPQLVGYLSISSLTQEGLDELKTALGSVNL